MINTYANKQKPGFTIVELLIVIVVIGILAAISIAAYNGVSSSAHNTAVQSDLKNIGTKLNLHKAEHGTYPSRSQLAALGLSVTKSAYDVSQGVHGNYPPVYNLIYCPSPDFSRFGLLAKSQGGKVYRYNDGGVSEFTGDVLVSAGPLCAGAGVADTAVVDRVWFYSADAWSSFVGG